MPIYSYVLDVSAKTGAIICSWYGVLSGSIFLSLFSYIFLIRGVGVREFFRHFLSQIKGKRENALFCFLLTLITAVIYAQYRVAKMYYEKIPKTETLQATQKPVTSSPKTENKKPKKLNLKLKFRIRSWNSRYDSTLINLYELPQDGWEKQKIKPEPLSIAKKGAYYTVDILNEDKFLSKFEIIFRLGNTTYPPKGKDYLEKSKNVDDWETNIEGFNTNSCEEGKEMIGEITFLYDDGEMEKTFPAICK